MTEIIQQFEDFVLKSSNLSISTLEKDAECDEYIGYNFNVKEISIKFRKAKITPKKVGQFVTLWKRNSKKETEPFNESDSFDFYIIVTEENENYGLFLFPKNELIKRQILTTNSKEGKRGFRVYPIWTKTENRQAEKAQIWQTNFFINFNDDILNQNAFYKIIKTYE